MIVEMTKISESLFAMPMGKADPQKVRELSDRLFDAYLKRSGKQAQVIVADNSNGLNSDVPDDSGKAKP